MPTILAVSWSGAWQHYKLDHNQSMFTSLHVVREKGQEMTSHGCRRNVKECVVRVIKLDDKIQNHSDVLDFSPGCQGHPRCYIAVLWVSHTTRPVHHSHHLYVSQMLDKIISKSGWIFYSPILASVVWERENWLVGGNRKWPSGEKIR